MSQFLVFLIAITAMVATIRADGFYTIVAPKAIRPNSEYHVSVSSNSLTEPVAIRLTIEGTDSAGSLFTQEQEISVEPDTTKNAEFKLGQLRQADYKLKAEGITGLKFVNETSLNFISKSFSILIQTDKAIYKPGDTIKFRVLALDANTKPLIVNKEMTIHIADAKGNRIKQWLQVSTAKGVYGNELELSSQPVLGAWNIVVEYKEVETKKSVEVAEYVLPKFEVTVTAPPHATYKNGQVKATVRAKYTYGKPVKGEATVSIYPTLYLGSLQPFIHGSIFRKVVKLDGKATVEFDVKADLNLDEEYARDVIIDAIVEEELTGRRQNGSTKVTLNKLPYKIDIIKDAEEYKPGLPYSVHIKVAHHDGSPVTDKTNKVEVTIQYSWNEENKTTSEYLLDDNGMAKIAFTVPESSETLQLRAKYLEADFYLGYISRASSESNQFIRAKVLTDVPTVNKEVTIEVQTTENIKGFVYQVLGRGDVLISKTIDVPNRTTQVFKFLASFSMVPKANLIVYYIRADGEIVSDRVEIEFGDDLNNFVKLELSTLQSKPGQNLDITINTNPNSFVGLLGVDQSVLLLKKGNDITKDTVFNELKEYDSTNAASRPYYRKKRFARYPWRQINKYFDEAGAVLMTNAKEEVNPKTSPSFRNLDPQQDPRLYSTVKTDIGPPKFLKFNTRPPLAGPYAFSYIPRLFRYTPKVFLTHEIQNTWLFLSTSSGYEGKTTIHKKVPDTITSWVITGFSIDPITGLGLTKQPRTLNVFQPFFVSLNLPYSVKRGEVVSIPIVVFNYQDSATDAEVTLHNTDQEFEFAEITNEIEENKKIELYRKKTVPLKANSGTAISFMVKPKKVGHITIKVTATTSSAGDGVERPLLVEPEGVPFFVNNAKFMDLRSKSEEKANVTIEIPKNAVIDSTRIEVAVIGDILGSSIKNLESLIRMPYGCGEQNMLNFVPNIVVLEYLKNVNQLTSEIEAKTKKFMESGYQRELTYQHKDGSFSAFGESDKVGSTWLTAFVVKSFHQAAKHIDIEQAIIDRALTWLSDNQAPNGSFPEVGKVSHTDMQGGAGQGIALTAYTLIAFLENKEQIPKYRNTINKAIDYVFRNSESLEDNYALALAAYALQLAEHNGKDFILTKLDSKATSDAGQKWWHKAIPTEDTKNIWYNQPNSVNVEMTAYSLLAFIAAGQETFGVPILKWLVAQRNDKGGFQSTQDTVVGLQALAKFAEKISTPDQNVQVTVKFREGAEHTINVNRENSMVMQSYELPPNSRDIEISATGRGFAVVQISYKYNTNVTGAWPRFNLDPQVNKNSNPDYLQLTVCTSFVPAGGANMSNMAVMEVGFPSGFTADLDTLPSLEQSEAVMRVETKEGDSVVVLYFDNLTPFENCPTLNAFRTHKVANTKPAAVVVYDYYDNSRRARQFYKGPTATLCDICEGDDCGDTCTIRADEQKAEVTETQSEKGGQSTTFSSLSICTLVLAIVLAKLL